MKVTLPTQVFLDALGHTASVAATKSPKPVLECVALRAEAAQGLCLEATDLDVGIRIQIPDAIVDEPGEILVSAARTLAVVREVDEERITLVEENQRLLIHTGRSRFRIRAEAIADFVELPDFPPEHSGQLPGDLLRDMVRRTAFATAKEPGRYALHGVLFRTSERTLELVATDGRRLARASRELADDSLTDLRVIVGPKGLSLVERVMEQQPGQVDVTLEERQVLFRIGQTIVISRLIDGTFPSYDDVIPNDAQSLFTVGVADFRSALHRASLLTTRDARSVQFHIEPGQLTIRSRAPEVGDASVDVTIAYDGEACQLGFNPEFLTDALKVMDPDGEVRFEFTDEKSPGKLTDRDDYVYVVMPIALE